MGLEHARQKGLIHRDVSPWNILVTSDGIAKLSDMGLAIVLGEEEGLTKDGTTVGDFDYLAPAGEKLAPATSIPEATSIPWVARCTTC